MIEINRKTIFLLVAMPTTAILLYWLIKSSKDDFEDEVEEKKKSVVTSRQTTIEIPIPSKAVGAVIGRQGQTIKELQEKSGAKINFRDDNRADDSDRTLLIRGTPEAAQSAECLVRKVIADMPVIVQEEITVPSHCLGRIIGRNGETIRQMSRASKTKIYIDRTKDDYRDQPRVVTISGAKAQIEIAKSLIQEKIAEEEAFRARAAVSAANREKRKGHGQTSSALQGQPGGDMRNNNIAAVAPFNQEPEDVRGDGDSELMLQTVPWPENKEYVEVYVSAVANPGIFWVQIVSSMALKLDELTADMSRHYGQNIEKPPNSVKIGDYVAAPFENDVSWYRAKVMEIKDDELDLFYMDYGDSGYLTKDKVRPLSAEYLQLPIQSIECRLARVKPNGEQWSEESIDKFEDLTYACKWKVLMAKAESYSGSTPHLTLIDTNSEKDVNINEEVVNQGFGVWET